MSVEQRRTFENVTVGAAILWLLWSWWSFTGVYRWVAIAELRIAGSFGAILTFLLSFVVVCALATAVLKLIEMISGEKAQVVRRPTPEEAKAKSELLLRRASTLLTAVSLLIVLFCAFGLWRFYHRTETATLDLSSPAPLPAGAGFVRLIGFARPELVVGVTTKSTGDLHSNDDDYMAIVGRDWTPDQPVPVVVKGYPAEGVDSSRFEGAAPGSTFPYLLPKGVIRSIHSGFAEYLLSRRGANVDRHTIFLDTSLTDERDLLFVVLGFSCLFLGLGALAMRRTGPAVNRGSAAAAGAR